jgi:hypothetical protein
MIDKILEHLVRMTAFAMDAEQSTNKLRNN